MVHYWVKNTEKKQSFETTASIAKLDDVEAQATYCVQVVTLFRVYVEDFRKGGSSVPRCITVSTSEDSFGYLFVPLVAFLLTIALTAVGVFLFIKYFRHNVKQIFHPSHRIPPHIEEFLQNPEQYYISSKLEETVSVPEQFDSLSFISDRD
ncbi:interferon gamma receptor 2 [Protopterus annectens]|uniref:interferon gamma receptor 2 n=1 Tax=Protopterus annectens TaxID=7888 RepID=UPI001CFB86C9|nr:interferon gamma receptor 2 [Protopterus annectens]